MRTSLEDGKKRYDDATLLAVVDVLGRDEYRDDREAVRELRERRDRRAWRLAQRRVERS